MRGRVVLLPSNASCVLVQMSAVTLRDEPAYRRMSRHSFSELAMSRIASVPQKVTALLHEVPGEALESAQVQLVHSGSLILHQGERETVVRAGELVIYDVSQPFAFIYPAEFRSTILQIPVSVLGVTASAIHAVSERSIPAWSTFANLVGSLARSADANHDDLTPGSQAAVSRAIVDATTLVVRERSGTAVDTSMRHDLLVRRAREYVRQNAHDPALSAQLIAARLHVSVRTLHAAFHDEPDSLARLIRRLRLERARALLATTDHPVRLVAESVGYLDVTHFIRLFKATEGVTPVRWRRRQWGGAAPELGLHRGTRLSNTE